MAVPVKQPINISFAQGLNQKIDPYQVPVGNFEELVNSVFDTVGRLTKRNGFPLLATLPDSSTSYLTTFNGDLQALGSSLLSYSAAQSNWVPKESTHPLRLSVQPLVRNALEQVQGDSALAPNGLVCTVYSESNGSSVSYQYVVADSVTGQNIVEPTLLPSADATYGSPRVFMLGSYFYILYTEQPSAYSLNSLAISYLNPSLSPVAAVVASSYTPASTVAFDAALLNGSLYIAYADPSAGVRAVAVSPLLLLSTTITVDGSHTPTLVSVAGDGVNQRVWFTYSDGTDGYTAVYTAGLIQTLAPTNILTSGTFLNITSTVSNNLLTFYVEVDNGYGYDSGIPTHYVETGTCTLAGTVSSITISARSVGLASKAFLIDGVGYYLGVYDSPYQPTYFLIDGSASSDTAPVVVAKIAYSNGGGYITQGLPNVSQNGVTVNIPYRFKDLLEAQAPSNLESINLQAPPVYSQTGLNLAIINFDTMGLAAAEAAQNLHLTGGFLWSYDGFRPIEHNFFLWPDSIELEGSDTTGAMTGQQYYYQVCYEWTDNQGNLFRSAPSIPVTVTLTDQTSVQLFIPTLRLTYKVSTPCRIVIYRWSVSNQTYYQVTSISTPLQNDTTIDFVTYTDTLADSTVVGNNIIYTTGGIVENVNAPASQSVTLFDNRVWLLDAENENTWWFSKTILPASPADMSDLQTYYAVSPAQAPGRTNFGFAMDDKLIQFKDNSLCYTNGVGPTDTGANSQYSTPIFITSTVGSNNPRSVVMTPSGLMFQSNKGIWLLGRDMSTQYIGAPVEGFNSSLVTSAQTIPGTNQVRFSLDTGEMLMYDYFVGQWGTFQGISSASSTVYNGFHTIVNRFGQVSQERVDTYLDGSNPVLMSFKTSWLQLAGLRGYMRAFWFYFLGTYLSPHKLQVQVGYDYNSSPEQSNLISPTNYQGPYGSGVYYGDTQYGLNSLENERIFLQRQRCKAFQVSIQEVFDPSFGTVAGPGLTLSGLSAIVGLKSRFATINSNQQTG